MSTTAVRSRDLEQVAAAGLNNVELVRRPHRGVTAAWNAGAARSTGDVLIFLNNDVVTTGPWAGPLASLLADERIVVAGVQRRERAASRTPTLLERLPTRVFAAGWCFAVRRRDFEAVGGFREALRLYFSDTDLQSRLLLRVGPRLEGIATRATAAPTSWTCDDRPLHDAEGAVAGRPTAVQAILGCGCAQGADAPRSPGGR